MCSSILLYLCIFNLRWVRIFHWKDCLPFHYIKLTITGHLHQMRPTSSPWPLTNHLTTVQNYELEKVSYNSSLTLWPLQCPCSHGLKLGHLACIYNGYMVTWILFVTFPVAFWQSQWGKPNLLNCGKKKGLKKINIYLLLKYHIA